MTTTNTNTDTANRICIIDGLHGIYVPQEFAERYGNQIQSNLAQELLEGPESSYYWEVWEEVLNTSKITFGGMIYTLEQDGDVFAVPEGEVAF